MTNIEKIRAALEQAYKERHEPCSVELRIDESLAALAELDRAAAEPVATVLGIVVEWTGEQPTTGTKLYAAQPAPVAEIREPTDDECRNIWREAKANEGDGSKVCAGRAMFDAVRAVLWPKEGL